MQRTQSFVLASSSSFGIIIYLIMDIAIGFYLSWRLEGFAYLEFQVSDCLSHCQPHSLPRKFCTILRVISLSREFSRGEGAT